MHIVVDKSTDQAKPRFDLFFYHNINVKENAFFNSQSEKTFFDVDIVVKNKSKCGLTLSVLLSTTVCVITVVKMLWIHEAQPSESTTF